MKISILPMLVAALGLAVFAVAGLLPRRATSGAEASADARREHGAEPWSFKEGRGILLSDAAKRALAVEIAPVEIGAVDPAPASHPAQIYRAAAESPTGDAAASLWLPAPEAAAISPGRQIEILHGQTKKSARVLSARKSGNGTSAPVEILLEIRDPAKTLQLGDFVTARIRATGEPRRATFVPPAAIVDSVRGSFVYALNGKSYLRTPVKVGSRSGDRVEIADGLFEGDEVVARGAMDLWLVELQAINGGKGCADGH